MITLRKGVFALALSGLAAGGLLTSPPASASGTAALEGGGGISPGLSTTPTDQTFNFSGTLVVAGVPGAGVYSCSVSGSSSAPETVATGGGSASGGCSGSPGSFTFGGSYTRAGGGVTVVGSASGVVSGTVVCGLAFTPTSAPTVTSYVVAGDCSVV